MAMRERRISIWYGKLEDAEPYPDLKYWQAQDDKRNLTRRGKW
jgi:hypothetical protein